MNLRNCGASFLVLALAVAQWAGGAAADVPRTRESVVEAARVWRTSSHESRTWTSTTGKTVDGRLAGLDDGSAAVFNRSLMRLRFADLSQNDLDYIEAIRHSLQSEEERLRTAVPDWKTNSSDLSSHLVARLKELPAPREEEAVSTDSVGLPTFDKLR
ncbi:MAG: hypothetical protein ABL994_23355, partial [Verrucomicrobiales bacterium]